MSNHMEAAVKAAAVKLHETWCGDDTPCGHPHGTDKHFATEIITAALPHIRAMVAQEIREEEQASIQEQQDQMFWEACVANAAQIAEGGKP